MEFSFYTSAGLGSFFSLRMKLFHCGFKDAGCSLFGSVVFFVLAFLFRFVLGLSHPSKNMFFLLPMAGLPVL